MMTTTCRSLTDALLTEWPFGASVTAPIAVLYENDAWTRTLFQALTERGVPFVPVDLGTTDSVPGGVDAYSLVINRVSPSADMRGNGPSIGRAAQWLEAFDRHGTPVINGIDAFRVETSKVAQYALIRGLGLTVPQTVSLDTLSTIEDLPADFPFPAILKPDRGGSGVGVQFVGSRRHLARLVDDDPALLAADHVMLLQQFVDAEDHTIMRMEFVGDELMHAMRVLPMNTFNLCPADGCERPPVDDARETGAVFTYAPDVPADAIDEARAIVRSAGLGFGGVEYIETKDGTRYFYDINATSVHRDDMMAAAGIDAMDRLVSLIESRLEAARTPWIDALNSHRSCTHRCALCAA